MCCEAISRLANAGNVTRFRPPDKSPNRLDSAKNEKSILHDAHGDGAPRTTLRLGHPLKDSPVVPRGTTWLVNERGQPFTACSLLQKWFGKRCRDAATGTHMQPDGLRKACDATDGRGGVVRDADGAHGKRAMTVAPASSSPDRSGKRGPV